MDWKTLSEILEIGMLICFGFSWPLNALKSYKARTTKGKSIALLMMIFIGYICGIVSKLANPDGFHWYVMFFYVLNICMVSLDIGLYFRNLALDKKAGVR